MFDRFFFLLSHGVGVAGAGGMVRGMGHDSKHTTGVLGAESRDRYEHGE